MIEKVSTTVREGRHTTHTHARKMLLLSLTHTETARREKDALSRAHTVSQAGGENAWRVGSSAEFFPSKSFHLLSFSRECALFLSLSLFLVPSCLRQGRGKWFRLLNKDREHQKKKGIFTLK